MRPVGRPHPAACSSARSNAPSAPNALRNWTIAAQTVAASWSTVRRGSARRRRTIPHPRSDGIEADGAVLQGPARGIALERWLTARSVMPASCRHPPRGRAKRAATTRRARYVGGPRDEPGVTPEKQRRRPQLPQLVRQARAYPPPVMPALSPPPGPTQVIPSAWERAARTWPGLRTGVPARKHEPPPQRTLARARGRVRLL